MYNIIRDALYALRVASLVKIACANRGCGCKPIGNYVEKPVGTTYIQLTVATPNTTAISFEITGDIFSIDSVAVDLHEKGVLLTVGRVLVSTEGKFSTVAMANSFVWKNYMIA